MIILYSTETCPMCKMLKRKLDEAKVDYEICMDVDQMKSLGISHVPVLSVDGSLMNLQNAIGYINSIESGEDHGNS